MRKNAFLHALLLCGALCIALLMSSLAVPGGGTAVSGTASRFSLVGEYSLNGSDERSPWLPDTRIPNRTSSVVFYGHVTQAVKPGDASDRYRIPLPGSGRLVLTFQPTGDCSRP